MNPVVTNVSQTSSIMSHSLMQRADSKASRKSEQREGMGCAYGTTPAGIAPPFLGRRSLHYRNTDSVSAAGDVKESPIQSLQARAGWARRATACRQAVGVRGPSKCRGAGRRSRWRERGRTLTRSIRELWNADRRFGLSWVYFWGGMVLKSREERNEGMQERRTDGWRDLEAAAGERRQTLGAVFSDPRGKRKEYRRQCG